MSRNQKLTSVAAALAIIAALTTMMVRHDRQAATSTAKLRAEMVQPSVTDGAILQAVEKANVDIRTISARNIGGIVVLRGTADPASAQRAVSAIQGLGFTRVANLLQPATPADDDSIRREAERQLANSRSLDGCTLNVSCNNGILRVSGTVQSELQQDAARLVLRSVRGAREVHVELSKL